MLFRSDAGAHRRLIDAGCEVLATPGVEGHVDLEALLDELGRRRMTNVMVEGGGGLLGAMMDGGLADEAWVYVSPRLVGGAGALRPLSGLGPALMPDCPTRAVTTRRIGAEWVHRIFLRDDFHNA